jgi:hypothetical protein
MSTTTLPKLTALAALAVGSLHAVPALAQMTHVPGNDWRQPDRHDAIERASKPPQFTVEVRFGPYLPNIDGHVPGGATPFADVFGLDCSSSTPTFTGSVKQAFSGGLEFDYTPFRIPYVGAVGAGLGWSFTQFSNQAQLTSSTRSAPQCSQEKTSLQIMPMHLSVVLRADDLMRRTGVPIVPYGKFGVGLAWWRSSNDLGTETVCGPASAPTRCGPGDTVTGHGNGLTPGLHFAVGAALALNFLQPQSSARLEQTTGVHHAYLFGEYYNDTITLVQNVMHVGAQSWVAGLAIDF